METLFIRTNSVVWNEFPFNTHYLLTQEIWKPFVLYIIHPFMSDSNKESSLLMSTDEYIDFMCLIIDLYMY